MQPPIFSGSSSGSPRRSGVSEILLIPAEDLPASLEPEEILVELARDKLIRIKKPEEVVAQIDRRQLGRRIRRDFAVAACFDKSADRGRTTAGRKVAEDQCPVPIIYAIQHP